MTTTAAKTEAKVEAQYPVAFQKAAGIPTCKKCGAPKSTGLDNEVICPEQMAGCPMLKAAAEAD